MRSPRLPDTPGITSTKSQHLSSHSEYLKTHGALLKPLLHDFLKSILLTRPNNAFQYASEYFQDMPTNLVTDADLDEDSEMNLVVSAIDEPPNETPTNEAPPPSPFSLPNFIPVEDTFTDLIPPSPNSLKSQPSAHQEALSLFGIHEFDPFSNTERQRDAPLDEFDDSTPFYENMHAADVDVLINSFLGSDKKQSLRYAIPYIFIDQFKVILFEDMDKMYGRNSSCRALVTFAIDMTLPLMAESDALYHDVDLVIQTVLLATSVIRALSMKEPGINVKFWTHVVVAILCSYASLSIGALEDDLPESGMFSTTLPNEPLIQKPLGGTNAVLLPYRVERCKRFIDEKFRNSDTVDRALLKVLIESTCFPFSFDPPKTFFTREIFENLSPRELEMCKLVLGCDLIVHLASDCAYKRLPRMYHELREANLMKPFEDRGINTMPVFRQQFHKLFWKHSLPHIRFVLNYLSITQTGQAWRSQLFGNLFESFYGFLVPDAFSKKHFTKWTASLLT